MAHSIITLDKDHLILRDAEISWVIGLASIEYAHVPLEDEKRDLLNGFFGWCDGQEHAGCGCIDLNFEEHLTSTESRQFLFDLLTQAEKKLKTHGKYFPAALLNSFSINCGLYTRDLEVRKMLPALHKFKNLLQRNLNSE